MFSAEHHVLRRWFRIVVDLLFIVASIVLWGFMVGPCFIVHYLVSSL